MSGAGRALCKEPQADSHTSCCALVTAGSIHIIPHYVCTALMSSFELQPAETPHSQGKDTVMF